jgi:hypothetical protein
LNSSNDLTSTFSCDDTYNGEDNQERLQKHGEVILELPDRVHVVPTKEHVSIGQLELSVQYLQKYKVNDDRLLIQFLWVVGSALLESNPPIVSASKIRL